MSTFIESGREIPDAPFYVLAQDTFLSGWGMSNNKSNIVILPCQSYDEAEIVAENAENRSDMKRVRINSTKPRLQAWNTYSLMDRDDADRWYQRGGFPRQQRRRR